MGKPAPRSQRRMALLSAKEALSAYLDTHSSPEQTRINLLWSHWEMVMGPELAELTIPIGHKKQVLHVAAEDSMAAQDISMQADEILERANAFMDTDYFSRLQVELIMGRNDLARQQAPLRVAPPADKLSRPSNLGHLTKEFSDSSPVSRCYQAYLRYFSRNK